MADGRVVVVGSLHYDILVEAPDRPRKGETLIGTAWRPKCGGKGGNQAVEAALAGARTIMVGAVGDDGFGRVLLDNLDRHGVDRSLVDVRPGASSGMSVAIVDRSGDYGAVVVSGVNRALAWPALVLAGGDVVVLQNEIAEEVNLAAASAAKAAGARVILNAAPARPLAGEFASILDLLVVNAVEAEMLGGGSVEDLDAAVVAARRLRRLCPAVVVTAGSAGLAMVRDGEEVALPAVPVAVRSTHGAGDCFVGVLAAALAAGRTLPDALGLANEAAGRLVATPEDERGRRHGAAPGS